ncbi:uncharacterized protein LOC131646265 [Vicia villosa]|uniref:uncharacterized protein LOC131646265 n=1 Tax=Vicia villosa TaxID=3911 RepID=UPI00273B1584|nr:uncharacterized protein LOC131646265 [Vicia villosa]
MSLPQYLITVSVYFNGCNPAVQTKIPDDTESFATLNETLNNFLSESDNRRVTKIEFREDWIDTHGRMKYNLIELKNDEDVKAMWKSFRCRIIKGLIELDAQIRRSVDDIMKCLKHPESSISTLAFMFRSTVCCLSSNVC